MSDPEASSGVFIALLEEAGTVGNGSRPRVPARGRSSPAISAALPDARRGF